MTMTVTITIPNSTEHGSSPSGGEEELYMLPSDCNPAKLFSKAINLDRLRSFTKQIPAKHILFLIDACVSVRSLIKLRDDGEAQTPEKLHEYMKNR